MFEQEGRRRPLIIGHRGAVGVMPENTAAAYAFAVEQGVDGVEFDVHLSRDGALVVVHDHTLERTAGDPRRVDTLTLAELRTLDAAAAFRRAHPEAGLPAQRFLTLDEALEILHGRTGLYLEIKTDAAGGRYQGIEEKVVQTLRRHGAGEGCVLSSFDFPTLETLERIAPDIRRHAIVSRGYFAGLGAAADDPAQVAAELAGRGLKWVAVNKEFLSPALARALHAAGMAVHGWVINTPAELEQMAAMGVDAVTTDRPDVLMAEIKTP